MAFPQNPSNGQSTTVNYQTYVYNSSLGVWTAQGTTASASPVLSVAGRTGAVVLTANDIGTGIFPGVLTCGAAVTMNSTLSVASTFTANGNATINATLKTNSLGVGTNAPETSGQILATNSITAFYSDERLKKDFRKIENALDKIDQLTGYLYTQNALAERFGYNNYEQQVGLRAGDVLRVQPEVVKLAPFDTAPDGTSKTGENYLTIQYEKLIPLLIEGIKELRQQLFLLNK